MGGAVPDERELEFENQIKSFRDRRAILAETYWFVQWGRRIFSSLQLNSM